MTSLPSKTKFAYGLPAALLGAISVPLETLLPHFYTDTMLVPIEQVAIAIMIVSLIDVFSEPVFGWATDKTRSYWGRRRPWVAVGALFASIGCIALFNPAVDPGPQGFIWLLGSLLFFTLALSMCAVPYSAWGLELVDDYHERTNLFAYATAFSLLGALVAAVLPETLSELLVMTPNEALALSGTIYGLAFLVVFIPLLKNVGERTELVRGTPPKLVPSITCAMRNPSFRVLMFSGVLSEFPAVLPIVLMPYHSIYVLQSEDWQFWVGAYIVAYLLVGVIVTPAWRYIVAWTNKRDAYVISGVCSALSVSLIYTAGPGDEGWVLICNGIMGITLGAQSILPESMAADMVDVDELMTGKRREAQYGSLLNTLPKLVAIPGAAVPLAYLGFIGYVPNVEQSSEVVGAIRTMIALVPVPFFLAASLYVLRYPLSESLHRHIIEQLKIQRANPQHVDHFDALQLFGRREVRRLQAQGLSHFRRYHQALMWISVLPVVLSALGALNPPVSQDFGELVFLACLGALTIALALMALQGVRLHAALKLNEPSDTILSEFVAWCERWDQPTSKHIHIG